MINSADEADIKALRQWRRVSGRMYEIGKNNGKAEKVQEATELLEKFLKEYYHNPIGDFEKGFVFGVRRAMGIIKDGGWE